VLLINKISSLFLFSYLLCTRVRKDESLLSFSIRNYLGMCWVSLCVFFLACLVEFFLLVFSLRRGGPHLEIRD